MTPGYRYIKRNKTDITEEVGKKIPPRSDISYIEFVLWFSFLLVTFYRIYEHIK